MVFTLSTEQDLLVPVSANGVVLTVSFAALTQFPESALARMAQWRKSAGVDSPLRLDCRPDLAVVLLQWLSIRHLCQRTRSCLAALADEVEPSNGHGGSSCCPHWPAGRAGLTADGGLRRCSDDDDGGGGGGGSPCASAVDDTSRSASSSSSRGGSCSGSCSSSSSGSGKRLVGMESGSGGSGDGDAGWVVEGGRRLWPYRPRDGDGDVTAEPTRQQQEHGSRCMTQAAAAPLAALPTMEAPSAFGALAPWNGCPAVRRRCLTATRYDDDLLPPLPALPPALQAEMDLLLDYLGLAADVYGSLPHVRHAGMPYLLARHDAAPHFSYRSRPGAMVLDGRRLSLTARGYAHASAPLTAAAAVAAAAGMDSSAGIDAAATPQRKLLWKVRLSYRPGGAATGGGGGGVRYAAAATAAAAACRPDTSLGLLLVHVEETDGTQRHGSSPPPQPASPSPSVLPVIGSAEAVAWCGPLPLLTAALPSHSAAATAAVAAAAVGPAAPATATVAAASAAAAAAAAGHGRTSLHLPGFVGWHVAGLAKGYDGACGGGAGSSVITRVGIPPPPPPPPPPSASAAPKPRADDSDGAGPGHSAGGGADLLFFANGDVLLFGLDPAARRLEMHHSRIGMLYSVALPPAPPPPSRPGAHGGLVREVPYVHVCMYDAGEALEVLDVSLGDLQLMGCI